MKTPHRTLFIRLLLVCALSLGATWPALAQTSASSQLEWLDKTTWSGRLDALVDVYPAPDAKGQIGAPVRYPVELLFERPDRYRLILRPGTKQELRIAAEAGIVRWHDLSTGFSGKDEADNVTHPLASALLATAGELLRFGNASDLPAFKSSPMVGARLDPKGHAAGVRDTIVWFGDEGQLIGIEINRTDGSRIFLAVLAFERNVKTAPGDFQL